MNYEAITTTETRVTISEDAAKTCRYVAKNVKFIDGVEVLTMMDGRTIAIWNAGELRV